jgi:hypothetical protein
LIRFTAGAVSADFLIVILSRYVSPELAKALSIPRIFSPPFTEEFSIPCWLLFA